MSGQFGPGLTMAMGSQGASSGVTPGSKSQAPPGSELSEEEMIQHIVQGVNEVLGRTFSLVEFDALQGLRLLQVLSDVFGTLSPAARVVLEDVGVEAGAEQLRVFLTQTLGYKVPPIIALSFADSIQNADTTVLYPVLYWVLTHMQQNKTRVYLATFLQRPDLDQALVAQDDDVRGLNQQYEALRTHFIDTHKRVHALRLASEDPAEARRKATNLQEEKEKLEAYIQAAEKKLAKVPNKEALITASKALRQEMDEELKLAERKIEQQQGLTSVLQRNTEISTRLQNVRRDAADGRVEAMVRRLRDEIQTNKIKAEEQLPKKIEETSRENEELRRLLSEPLDMQKWSTEDATLDQQLRELRNKCSERQRPSEDGSSIATIKQQVQRVLTKKQETLSQLVDFQEQNNVILGQIREKEARIAQFRDNNSNVLTGDEFRLYTSQVRSKTATAKSMKSRLAELRAEYGVLTYTQSTLQAQFEELRGEIEDLESKMGIRGYAQVSESIEEVTNKKNEVELIKGKTLEELSRVVQEFTLAIRERRSKLAPQIGKLREVRKDAADVDGLWNEARLKYEHQENMLMEDIAKTEQEVEVLHMETKVNEAVYHQLRAQVTLLDAQLQRAQTERRLQEDLSQSLYPQCRTYTDLINSTSENLKAVTKELQGKRRDVDDNHAISVQQVEWFANLKKILEVKFHAINAAATSNHSITPHFNVDNEIQQVMGMAGTPGARGGGVRLGGMGRSDNAVDMLVLGSY